MMLLLNNFLKKKLVLFQILAFLTSSLFLFNCAGNLEQELQKLDKIYGYCDNPQRNIKGYEYRICKDKEAAMGPTDKSDPSEKINIANLIDGLRGKNETSVVTTNTNPFLWRASLEVLESYDIKIADNEGGFIQTEWISQADSSNLRCMIKINVTSSELVSNGVETLFICQQQKNAIWEADGNIYTNEEKTLTLRILELAQTYSSQSL